MYRLTYVSTAHPAVSTSDLQDVLEAAIRNNTAAKVTGTLLFNGENFMQVLEGDRDEVRKIYNRICVDARHSHIVTIYEEESASRSFGESPMSLQVVRSDVGELPKGMTVAKDFELYIPASLPSHVRKMLRAFNTRKA